MLPILGAAGAPLTFEGMVIGGGIGVAANVGFQLVANGGNFSNINKVDAAMAGVAGTLTYGATFASTVFINTGTSLIASAFNNSNATDSRNAMLGAVVGSALGYGFGSVAQDVANPIFNPWYREEWKDMGLTIQKFIPPSKIPSVLGTWAGSATSEVGSAGATNQISRQGN